ncbi:MAG: hypothetical protein ACTTI3_08815 [Treponema sp.]
MRSKKLVSSGCHGRQNGPRIVRGSIQQRSTVMYNIRVAHDLASLTKIGFCQTSFLFYTPTLHGGTEQKLVVE